MTAALTLLLAASTTQACRNQKAACEPDDLADLQETCLEYGGSFAADSSSSGSTECEGEGSASKARGACKIQGAGTCSILCSFEDEDTDIHDDTDIDNQQPVSRSCGDQGWIDVDLDGELLCGVCADGGLACFDDGQPLRVPAGRDYSSVAVGTGTGYTFDHEWPMGCALRRSGAAECWSWDRDGVVTPLQQLNQVLVGLAAIDVATEAQSVCALTPTGGVTCTATSGRAMDWPPGAQSALEVGEHSACFLGGDALGRCTGSIESRYLADADAVSASVVGVDVAGHGLTSEVACFLTNQGGVECFGDFSYSGVSGPIWSSLYAEQDNVVGLKQFAMTWHAVCGIDSSGLIQCWGDTNGGAPPGIFSRVVSGFGGGFCALRDDAALRCWDNIVAP